LDRCSIAPPASDGDKAISDAIEAAQRTLLRGLLVRLVELSGLRTPPSRLSALTRDIEAIARRNGWSASADLVRLLQQLVSNGLCASNCALINTIAILIERAAARPQEDWLAVVTTTRIAVGVLIERHTPKPTG
jgi:hypothetical protein